MLKITSIDALEKLAGSPMPQHSRDMSPYNGTPFECVCGETHLFNERLNNRNYVAFGTNATMIASCTDNKNNKTLITTKYKFVVMFKGFESIAGYKED